MTFLHCVFCSAMTALESWCLGMIGLVFESLLGYVVLLFCLFRGKRSQVQIISFHGKTWIALKSSPWFFLQQVISPMIPEEETEQKRNWKLELFLFSWVKSYFLAHFIERTLQLVFVLFEFQVATTAIAFNIYYWTKEREGMRIENWE